MNKTLAAFAPVLVVFALSGAMVVCAEAQTGRFEAGQIAVLRVGDGGSGGASDLASRQTPVFIDEFDPGTANQSHPAFSVAIPTSGAGALWINGNASTEGGMARSEDRTVLTLSGYCGDILSKPGVPSKVGYDRGICVVGADGSTHLAYRGTNWYGLTGGKTNPRSVVSDGTNNFWGCGSEMGDLFFNHASGVVPLKSPSSTRAIKFINHTLCFSIMSSDGEAGGAPGPAGGIYDFVDASHSSVPLPKTADLVMDPVVTAEAPYTHTAGFDMNPQGTIAYLADIDYGIQKYVKTGGAWKLACNFYIPGYDGPKSGILTNAASTKVRAGCFGLAVDFSGANPVVYATTTESVGYQTRNVNSNRLIRLDDTNTTTSGDTITNFAQTLATAWATNVAFRAIDFTPEARR